MGWEEGQWDLIHAFVPLRLLLPPAGKGTEPTEGAKQVHKAASATITAQYAVAVGSAETTVNHRS
jgi:hypothetical protein